MRKIILFVFLAGCIMPFVHGQSSAYQKLLADCSDIFLKYTSTGKATAFLNGFDLLARYKLRPDDTAFKMAVVELRGRWPQLNDQQISYKTADSILTDLQRNDLWKGAEDDLSKFNTVLKLFNDKYCACIASKDAGLEDIMQFEKVNQACDAALTKDIVFMNSMRSHVGVFSQAEQVKIQSLMARYLYGNCPVYTRINKQIYLDENNRHTSFFIYSSAMSSKNNFLSFVQKSKPDSLKFIFSGYKGYKNDIESLRKILTPKTKNIATTDDDITGDSMIVKTTLYNDVSPKKITGQIELTIDCRKMFTPLILSVVFTPADKITNIPELMRRIEDEDIEIPPPPPMEMPRNQ